MRTTLVLILSLLCAPGLTEDFREMDLGGDCRRVRDLEGRAGSSLLHSDDNSYTFIGMFQGWPVTIHYQCRGGRFVEGMYLFEESSPAEAASLFGAIKRLMVAERGAPTVDFSVPEHRRMPRGRFGEEARSR